MITNSPPGFRLFPPALLVLRPYREHRLLGSCPLPVPPGRWLLAATPTFMWTHSLSLETTGPNHREWGPGLGEPALPGSKKGREGPGPPSKLRADVPQSWPPSPCPQGDCYWRQRGLQACVRWQAGTREPPLASVPTVTAGASGVSQGLGRRGFGLGVAVSLGQEALGTPSLAPGPLPSLWKVAMPLTPLSPRPPHSQPFTGQTLHPQCAVLHQELGVQR